MQIVDNSPEMDLTDARLVAVLNKTADPNPPPSEKSQAEKSDVKPSREASSAPAQPAPEPDPGESESDDESPDALKAKIKGFQAELARRKGNAEKVADLEARLAQLQEQMTKSAPAKRDDFAWLRDLDDHAFAVKQTDWDDELSDARARYGRAEEAGDAVQLEKQGQRIAQAKMILAEFRKEHMNRVKRTYAESTAQAQLQTSVQTELTSMYDTLSQAYPEFNTKDSELWKAGQAEYQAHPTLMRQLGPLGEVVAAAMAVIKHKPSGTDDVKARRDVLGKLETGLSKALRTGASAPSTKRSVDISVESGEGLAAFNAMIDRIKGG